MTLSQIKKVCDKFGLGEFFKAASPYAKNAVKMHLKKAKDEKIKVGASKIGGVPDLPPEISWHADENQLPMSLIAQINFSEICEFDLDGKLPKTGMLYLFYDCEQMAWGYDPKDVKYKNVIYFDGDLSTLKRADVPENFKDYVFKAAPVKFESRLELPSPQSMLLLDFMEKCEEFDYDAYSDAMDEIYDGFDINENKILGHSNNIQGEMELECELVNNGLYCGDSSAYHDPRAKELAKNAHKWRLLLQIDSNDENEMMWGDLGRLYLWIREDDLAQRNFGASWLVLQCG